MIIPPLLAPGSTIGITATARKVLMPEITFAIQSMTSAGYKIILSPEVFAAENQFAGSDEMRAAAFNQMLANPEINAIWCARGGYGSVRLLEKIDWHMLKQNPKWIMGFSDVTAIHSHVYTQAGACSIHCPMPFAFEKQTEASQQNLLKVLSNGSLTYQAPSHLLNRKGATSGKMVGGNLSVLYSLLASKSHMQTNGCILFLEDLDEYLYHIDRMMMALKRAGMLENLSGLVVGGMTDMHDNPQPFGSSVEEIVLDAVKQYDYPVCFGFPSGHIPTNFAWIHGAETSLSVGTESILTQKI